MDTVLADLRYAVRSLAKNTGFAAIAMAALALGIGASTAIFTVVNAVLLQPLPYPQPDRIMKLGRQFATGVAYSNSIPKYFAWRQNQAFQAMAIYDFGALAMNLGSGDPPQPVRAVHVSGEYFKVFGVSPLMGRTFSDSEDLPKGPAVAVIGYGLWQSRLGGVRDIVGRTILLNAAPYVVVGILPPGFQPDPEADLWLPMQADPLSTNQGHYLNVAGRLKPGISVAAAQAEMKVMGERFRKANPKWMDDKESVAVTPMRDATTGDVRTALLVLFGAVALVLLIACANVANLLLSRAAGRQRELAIRAALGASRARVVRQLLTESVLLAGCGGLLGFALGAAGVRGLLLLAPGNIPRLTATDGTHTAVPLLDLRVALFTIAVSVLTGIVFGLFPALHTSKPNLSTALKEASGRSGTGLHHNRVRSALVVSEVALAVVLLIGATLLIRTFVGLRSVNPGFDAHNVLTVQTSLAGGAYGTTAKVNNLSTQIVRRIESLPGVEAAASAVALPVENGIDLPFSIAGKPSAQGDYNGDEQWRFASPHYFRTFKIPLLRGRTFDESDSGNSARVVVINEVMAKKYWGKEDPVGQVITIGKGLGPQFDDPPRQIVGIVGNVRESGLANQDSVMYIPQSQVPEGLTALANNVIPLSWAIRTATEPMSMRAAVERELHAVDGLIPVSRERSMEQVITDAMSRQNFNMVLLSIFAGVALVLAAIGIYGLMSYSVQQRTQEIGIRMALGAARSNMLNLVLRQGMMLAGIGLVLGLALAFGAARVLGSLLFGVKASDPRTFGAVAAILAMVALVAVYIPARRATAIDPAISLRYE
ncbi:MAG: ABC transporter permease [Bryobacterales bacterium]|nr:ABC transporter permease [Bryobacterales bacterium]MBV9397309.1 ABC transporter permease [Bryobacterales bacterium]